jgi:hypothetical protein
MLLKVSGVFGVISGALLVSFMARSLDIDRKSGFEAMNRALKERAEKG